MGGLFLSQRSSSCLGKENKGCEELITGELFFRCYIDYIVLRKKEKEKAIQLPLSRAGHNSP